MQLGSRARGDGGDIAMPMTIYIRGKSGVQNYANVAFFLTDERFI